MYILPTINLHVCTCIPIITCSGDPLDRLTPLGNPVTALVILVILRNLTIANFQSISLKIELFWGIVLQFPA